MRQRRPMLVVQVVITAVVTLVSTCGGEPGYKASLRRVEAELTQRNTEAKIQLWLAQQQDRTSLANAREWPSCIKEVSPIEVMPADCGGVSLSVVYVEVFTITVCPPGARPPLAYHEPSYSRPGYLGPFGKDSYIFMAES